MMNSRSTETDQERIVREKSERDAVKRSKEIDEWLQKEKTTRDKERKKRKTSKILLLGKSTTLKNFQLHYAPKAFEAERMQWKTVIHLNIVRSIRKINDALTTYAASRGGSGDSRHHQAAYPSPRATPLGSPIVQKTGFEYFAPAGSDEDNEESDLGVSTQLRRPKLTSRQNVLLMRLRPILSLEPQLLQSLLSTESNGPAPPVFLPTSFGSSLHKFAGSPQELPPHPAGSTSWRTEVPDDYASPTADFDSSLPTPISPILVSDEVALPAGWNTLHRTSTFNTLSSIHNSQAAEFSSFSSFAPSSTVVPHNNSSSSRRQRSEGGEGMTITPKSSLSTSGSSTFSPLSASSANNNHNANSGFEKPLAESNHNNSHQHQPNQRSGGGGGGGGGSGNLWGSNPNIRGSMRSPTPSMDPFEVPERILAACASDILSLWRDDVLRNMLCGPLSMGGLGLKLHEDAGFFLDDIERVTAPNYVPTDDDVLRARLRTMGVSEHRFVIEE
ncbi:hypothetical protein FRC17_006385, partial [Serendipita sp. 399]